MDHYSLTIHTESNIDNISFDPVYYDTDDYNAMFQHFLDIVNNFLNLNSQNIKEPEKLEIWIGYKSDNSVKWEDICRLSLKAS